MSEELLPCPFCGFVPTRADIHDIAPGTNQHHQCAGCHAYGPRGYYPEVAIALWNQRAAISVSDGGGSDASGASTLEKKEAVTRNTAGGQTEPYPDVLTPKQRKIYETALEQVEADLERICKELDDCQRLTAADFAVTINAR